MATDHAALWAAAQAAGHAAAAAAVPTTMTVRQHANGFDDNSAVVQEWHVNEGVCGFGYISIHPATSGFVRWLRNHGIGFRRYHGGWQIGANTGSQSYERNRAYAEAAARVLQEAGLTAFAESRLD